jgi:hypothetical protein
MDKVALGKFKELSQYGGGQILLKNSALLYFIKAYPMRPLSARSISMDSTFKYCKG